MHATTFIVEKKLVNLAQGVGVTSAFYRIQQKFRAYKKQCDCPVGALLIV